jgi:hypothetical protein
MPAARVAARAAAGRRGAAGKCQREAGRARRKRARGTAQSGAGAAGVEHMAGEGGGSRAQRKQRSRGWRRKMRTGL